LDKMLLEVIAATNGNRHETMEAAGSPAAAEAEEADVWSSFEKSVAYIKEVAALYDSAFGCSGRAEPAGRKTVTKAHLDEAHNQAQQALELLASNLLNVSMTIVNIIEKQVRGREREEGRCS
jgi:hypothetical protein